MKKLILVTCLCLLFPTLAISGDWTLEIRYGITGWGAGGVRSVKYPSEESCYKSLDRLVVKADQQQSGEDDEQVIAFCRPAQ